MVEKSNCLKVGVIEINLANQFSKNPIIPTIGPIGHWTIRPFDHWTIHSCYK